MSQWEADPNLVRRRLETLVALLRKELKHTVPHGTLTPTEMEQWAHQCSNLLNAPMRKATKPIESMTDEELLS